MRLEFFGYCFIFLFFISCSVDYEIGESFVKEQQRIVVNGYLSPGKPIQIHLYELMDSGGSYIVKGLTGSHVVLRENGIILFDAICPDSIFVMQYNPQAGATYSIEVIHEGLQTVKAQTGIPDAIHCRASFFSGKEYWDTSQYIVKLDSFEWPQNEGTYLWITAYQLFENGKVVQYNELYTNNVLVDKLNSVAGMGAKNETVGSIYYNGFLRIKNKNIPHLTELLLTPNYVADGSNYNPEGSQNGIRIKLMTASSEYDKYNKSLYEQKYRIVYDEDISSVFYQPNGVYTNVENGLGIFAGMNEVNFVFGLPVDDH